MKIGQCQNHSFKIVIHHGNWLFAISCNQPFEAAKARHLRVRRFYRLPHPEVRALVSLEGLVVKNSDFRSGLHCAAMPLIYDLVKIILLEEILLKQSVPVDCLPA